MMPTLWDPKTEMKMKMERRRWREEKNAAHEFLFSWYK